MMNLRTFVVCSAIVLLSVGSARAHVPHDIIYSLDVSPTFSQDGLVFVSSTQFGEAHLVSSNYGETFSESHAGMRRTLVTGHTFSPDFGRDGTVLIRLVSNQVSWIAPPIQRWIAERTTKMAMNQTDDQVQLFSRLLVANQRRLYGFILTLVQEPIMNQSSDSWETRLDELVAAMRDDNLSDEQSAELQNLFNTQSGARRRFAELMHLTAMLGDVQAISGMGFQPVNSPTTDWKTTPLSKSAGTRRFRAIVTLLLASSATILFALLWMRPEDVVDDFQVELLDEGVAVVTQSYDTQWAGESQLQVGSSVSPGTVELLSGLIQLEFYRGAVVVVEGPAELQLVNADRLICRHGRLRAHVPPQAEGFAVVSPNVELVDLGTEFGMDVSSDGSASVHVFDGQTSDSGRLDGAIVGCRWTEGRWSGKDALEFKHPGDRVRLQIPGEFDSLTYSAWVPIDGLDRPFIAIVLTNGYDVGEPHWQLRDDGRLLLGIQTPSGHVAYDSKPILNIKHLGRWTHLATVYDSESGQVAHYIDGENVSVSPITTDKFKLRFGETEIGNWGTPVKYSPQKIRNFNGQIDELTIFRQPLTASEVKSLYTDGIR